MNFEDLKYMRCGKIIKPVQSEDKELLAPIHVHNKASGKALLLLHGFSSSPAVYREIQPIFPLFDAVHCPALPGHVESVAAFANSKSEEWVNCAYNAYQYLAKNYSQVDVLGLSLGGLLALKVAAKFPVNHLYVLAPALKLHGWTKGLLLLARILNFCGLHKLPNRGGNIHVDSFAEITYKDLPLATAIQLLSLILDYKFTEPSCPTDLFVGKYDEVVDSTAVAKLFQASQQTKIHWLNNSAHVLPIDGNIEKIIKVITDNQSST